MLAGACERERGHTHTNSFKSVNYYDSSKIDGRQGNVAMYEDVSIIANLSPKYTTRNRAERLAGCLAQTFLSCQ